MLIHRPVIAVLCAINLISMVQAGRAQDDAPATGKSTAGSLVNAALPFKLEFEEVHYADERVPPRLQSYVHASTVDGKWLVLGGRTQGLHTFRVLKPDAKPEEGNFPPSTANNRIFVIDPEAGVEASFDVNLLPREWAEPLQSTNQQGCRDDANDKLYIVGGYGAQGDKMVTFDTIMRLSPAAVVAAITSAGTDADRASNIKNLIELDNDARFAVTGGALCKTGNTFLLVFGHVFIGQYTAFGTEDRFRLELAQRKTLSQLMRAGGSNLREMNLSEMSATSRAAGLPFLQFYTEQYLVFTLEPDSLKILSAGAVNRSQDPAHPFHRRDGNFLVSVDPASGNRQVTAFGGVFPMGIIGGHTRPIRISRPGLFDIAVFEQKFSQYECPVMITYSPSSATAYHTFFGGISSHYYKQTPPQQQVYKSVSGQGRNDGLPFIADITTLVAKSDGTFVEYIHPDSISGNRLLGAAARFIPNTKVLRKIGHSGASDIVDLDRLQSGEKVVIGYVYGGIEADFPLPVVPSQGTQATNTVFRVSLTKTPTAALPAEGNAKPAAAEAHPQFQMFRLSSD